MRQKPSPKGSDRMAILSQSVDADFGLGPRAGGVRAMKLRFDIVGDRVDVHRRPMAITATEVVVGSG